MNIKICHLIFTFFFVLSSSLLASEHYQLSTHVLDTSLGKPGEGVHVTLEKRNDQGEWIKVEEKITNKDGRIGSFLKLNDKADKADNSGMYRFTFKLDEYFEKRGEDTVFPEAVIVFRIQGDAHYHIPLVVTPYALSTYRGS